MTPAAAALVKVDLPETFRYRLKNRLLGPPIASDRQSTERLGKPTALAVLSSDVISSSAYATEQMLIPLVIAIGAAAYSLVIPVTFAVIFVLLFVTLSYLEVVKVYTKAGGAYVVARENFGLTVAQVAAMSLLIDYTLTVAVSVAAGVAAITSVFPGLTPETTWIAVGLVLLIAYGNLRGIREAGRTFAVPTYFFIANMVILMAVRRLQGHRRVVARPFHLRAHGGFQPDGPHRFAGERAPLRGHGVRRSQGLRLGRVGADRHRGHLQRGEHLPPARVAQRPDHHGPDGHHPRIAGARRIRLASVTHPVPYVSGTPTVIYQIGKFVYGGTASGQPVLRRSSRSGPP